MFEGETMEGKSRSSSGTVFQLLALTVSQRRRVMGFRLRNSASLLKTATLTEMGRFTIRTVGILALRVPCLGCNQSHFLPFFVYG